MSGVEQSKTRSSTESIKFLNWNSIHIVVKDNERRRIRYYLWTLCKEMVCWALNYAKYIEEEQEAAMRGLAQCQKSYWSKFQELT